MMQIEFPKMHQSQQDMELIDILWRQDIDLGAGREVFDDSHRQKEHERRRQRELEEEEQRQRLRDQEKTLLAQLQLDEETGEFVPRPPPTATPPEPTQTVIFTEEDGDALSFDECMLLLEETFPLVEAVESAPLTVDPSISAVPGSGTVAMGPHQAPLPHLLATPPPVQKTVSDMEQVWMELLSIPELQQCLNMQTADDLEPAAYTMASTPPRVQDPPYSFYLPKLTDVVVTSTEAVGPPGYHSTIDGPFTAANPPDNLNQMTLEASDLNASFTADRFCDIFYPDLSNVNMNGASPLPSNEEGGCPLAELSDEVLAKPEFVPEEGFESERPEMVGELPDSDSSVSLGASPNFSSSEKSLYDDGSMGYSDSDMEDTDSNSGSAETDCTEVFPLTFNPDAIQAPPSATAQPALTQGEKVKHPKTEPTEGVGHNKPPFTKDKHRRRAESRLSRDEQRAKALQIPFTVDMIINLPVDDFNEMMSKHQLNEAQLALVRDIRRRGKNKVAAQNCRKRKMESIAGLEYELDSLKEQKERLLREKLENDSSLRQAKRQLSSLYQEVFSMLRDQEGRPYSPSEYSLQQTSEGNVFLVPRVRKTSHKADAPFSA